MFCENCFNLLIIKEIQINEKKEIYYFCNNCDYNIKCDNKKISSKDYNKNIKINYDHLNKYKKNDITLPKKITKCFYCKNKNENKYEINYYNNYYNIYNICSKCNKGHYH